MIAEKLPILSVIGEIYDGWYSVFIVLLMKILMM